MPNTKAPIVDVVSDGDVLVALNGLAGHDTEIALRVSSHILAMTSPVFKALLAEIDENAEPPVQLTLAGVNSDAMFMILQILHFRNDKVPFQISAMLLYEIASLADKYQCVVAVGRAMMQWFDVIYHSAPEPNFDVFRVIEAAQLLKEVTYFARFSERCILGQRLDTEITSQNVSATRSKLVGLTEQRTKFISTLREEIDLMVDACLLGFDETAKHHIDYAPGMDPDSDDEVKGGQCWVDRHAGMDFLAALRKATICPSTVWPKTLGEIVGAIKTFKVPDYDDSDKCDFCEDVKDKFRIAVRLVKDRQEARVWGLCLN